SETTHERCFAVVDVACRADDHSATSSIPNGRPDRGFPSWRSVDMQARVIEATTPCSVTSARAICATATAALADAVDGGIGLRWNMRFLLPIQVALQLVELGDEAGLVIQTAQVEKERSIPDMADHRDREGTE